MENSEKTYSLFDRNLRELIKNLNFIEDYIYIGGLAIQSYILAIKAGNIKKIDLSHFDSLADNNEINLLFPRKVSDIDILTIEYQRDNIKEHLKKKGIRFIEGDVLWNDYLIYVYLNNEEYKIHPLTIPKNNLYNFYSSCVRNADELILFNKEDKLRIKLPKLEDLVLMKEIAGRERDLKDISLIEYVLKANNQEKNLDINYLKGRLNLINIEPKSAFIKNLLID
ncbi:MAG: hypothetical protein QXK80_01645 [Candidatus Pacearchaeota archaeon]